jgi:hypothetical protein
MEEGLPPPAWSPGASRLSINGTGAVEHHLGKDLGGHDAVGDDSHEHRGPRLLRQSPTGPSSLPARLVGSNLTTGHIVRQGC